MKHDQPITFEQKFGAYIPHEGKISNKHKDDGKTKHHKHDDAGIAVKSLAYLIDLGLTLFVVPLLYNIYSYLRWGQTIGQRCVGIRIYGYHSGGAIATIHQLMNRVVVKMIFLVSWAVIGINVAVRLFDNYTYDDALGLTYSMVYILIMIVWIHGYAITMTSNRHRRGMHDLFAGTIVAYDKSYSIKRILLCVVACVVLYYVIMGLGPIIIDWVNTEISQQVGSGYWSAWEWIDSQVITGLDRINF